MNRTRAERTVRLLTPMAIAALAAGSLFAQPGFPGRGERGDGDRGGFGGRGGIGGFRDPTSLTSQVRSDSVQEELGLSDEQRERLREVRPDMSAMTPLFQRLREATDEDERSEIMREMRESRQQAEAQSETELRKILSGDQMSRLLGVVYREAGPRALTRPELADELELTKQQRDELRRLNDERSEAFRELGFRVSDEDRQKFDQEWNAKLTAVLTPDQQKQWQAKLPAAAGQAGPATPANAVSPAVAAGTGAARPALIQAPGSITRNADGTAADRVVASFDVPRDAAARSDDPYDPTMLSFNFQNAPWADVLDLFAKQAGFTLDALDVPPGSFTYKDTKRYTPLRALDVLHGYLLQRGHVMVYRDKFLVVLNIEIRPIPPNLVPRISLEELDRLHREGIQNQIVQVVLRLEQGLDAEQVSTQIEGLLGPQRQVVPLKGANALAIRDTVSHLMNLRDILDRMTVPPNPEDVVIRAFPLKHILASEAEPHVRALFGLQSATPNMSSAASRDPRTRFSFGGWPGFGGDRDRDRDSRDSRTPTPALQTPKPVQVTADRRTNTLLVAALPTQLNAVEEMLRSIDVPVPDGVGNLVANNTPVFKAYEVRTAEADEVAQTLTALMPHVVINDDDQRGRGFVHIWATPLEHQKVAEYIRLMDGGTGSQSIDILRIGGRYDPSAVAAMLNQMFLGDGQNAPTIQGELTTRSLMVKGSPEQIIMVRAYVSRMGLDGEADAIAGNGSGGRFRPVSTLGRDPEKVARRIRDILQGTGSFENRINVIIPRTERGQEDLEVPPGTPRINFETPADPDADEFRRLETPRPDFGRSQTSTSVPVRRGSPDPTVRRGSPDPADVATAGLQTSDGDLRSTPWPGHETRPQRQTRPQWPDDERSTGSPRQEVRPLQGIRTRENRLTAFDLPEPSQDIEVDLVPGTGILILKGPKQELDTLWPTSDAAPAAAPTPAPHPLATGARVDGDLSAQFVSLVQESGPAESAEPKSPSAIAGDADLGQVLSDLEELLDLEDFAEQEPAAADQPAETAPAQAPGPSAQPRPAADEGDRGRASRSAPATGAKPEVTIEVQGGKLYIYSADERALDQIESAVADILSEMPAETVWTVFYLRVADVVDAADMLSRLMPDTTISTMAGASSGGLLDSFTGGFSSMASGLMSATGLNTLGQGPQTLQIIPDLRSNSLWVSGPVDKVRDVKAFLEKLDSDELPESLRDRVPRTIDVYYSDVNEVATMVRELYRDYMEDPNDNRNRGGNNPLAMFMGGGGSSSTRGGRPSGIRLTLAVDERTNQLIVSCSNSLYDQIKRTVEARDLAAQEARRTVRFVTVDSGSSSVIQETLSRALPNVRVSTTGTPADRRAATTQQRPGSSSSDRSDRGGGSSDEDRERAERLQRFMEMRQRMQSGDSGGSGGSSSGRSFGGSRDGSDRGRSGSSSSGRSGFGGGFPSGGFGGFGGRSSDGDRRGRD